MASRRNPSPRRRSRRTTYASLDTRTLCLLLILAAGVWAFNSIRACNAAGKSSQTPETDSVATVSDYGNLLKVTTNPGLPSQEKSYTGMDISFNSQLHVPNWVSWELTSDEISGGEERSSKFSSDPDIEGCAETWDYNYSGYDRGHMAPAGDMKWSRKAMDDTFYLTNICPQVHSLNNGVWKRLEEKCRLWASRQGKIYIVCGPIIEPSRTDEYLGDTRVWVPRRFFKVIIAPYATPAMGIGFIMPNSKVSGGMQKCVVTIDEIEELTGHDFFASLPDEIENEIENQANFAQWEIVKRN